MGELPIEAKYLFLMQVCVCFCIFVKNKSNDSCNQKING